MFRALCAHHQEVKSLLYSVWYHHICRWPSGAQVESGLHKIFFYNKFIIRLNMFRALCAHHQEAKIVLYGIWYHHTCSWPSGAQVESGLDPRYRRGLV